MPRQPTTDNKPLTRAVQIRFHDDVYEALREISRVEGLSIGEVVRTLVGYVLDGPGVERLEQAFDERLNRKLQTIALEQWLENDRRADEDDRPL